MEVFNIEFLNTVDDKNPDEVADAYYDLKDAIRPNTHEEFSQLYQKIILNEMENLNLFLIKNFDFKLVDLGFLNDIDFFGHTQLRILYVLASNQEYFVFPKNFVFKQTKYYDNFTNIFNSKLMELIEFMVSVDEKVAIDQIEASISNS